MNRISLLNQLINHVGSIDDINEKLSEYPWDSDDYLVTLTKEHIKRLLEKYLIKETNENEIEKWANAIESREDVEFEEGYEELINQCIYELANPYLTEKLTKEKAKKLLNKL